MAFNSYKTIANFNVRLSLSLEKDTYMKSMTLLLKLILLLFLAVPLAYSGSSSITDSKKFKDYWYSGTAEITSYKIEQARYGEIHEGHAVLVFVTEDFSKKKQVKLDNPTQAKGDAVKILKLNRIKKFNTGIYRYSIMDSVFTPVNLAEFPNTLKVSSSSQEWCGNTFKQLNLGDDRYELTSLSYFESEGDKRFNLKREFLEDEAWTRIRLDPKSLPVGKINIIPGAMASRLTHKELKVERAVALLEQNQDDVHLMDYKIAYDNLGRSIKITFNKHFPYEIVSWEEAYLSSFGKNARKLTTKATKNKSVITDYWNKNKRLHKALREELGL